MGGVYRSDPQLIQSCLAGDEKAWNELMNRYSRMVYSIARRYRMHESDSEDILQTVFLTLFQKLDQVRDQTRISAWLITTTHRECWKLGKKLGKYPDLDEHIADVSAPEDHDLELWEQQQQVRTALEKLGGKCQDLLTALFMEVNPQSYESIAMRLGIKVGSIGPTRARCFEKLEQILVQMGFSAKDEENSKGDG